MIPNEPQPIDLGEAVRRLELAAHGRRTYANGAAPEVTELLEAEADAFDLAARIIRDPNALRDALPSWQWSDIEAGAA